MPEASPQERPELPGTGTAQSGGRTWVPTGVTAAKLMAVMVSGGGGKGMAESGGSE
jgi:hypothetical protein